MRTILSSPSIIGGVAKRTKATDCKSVIRGFESHRRLFSPVRSGLLSEQNTPIIPPNFDSLRFSNGRYLTSLKKHSQETNTSRSIVPK